MTSRIERSVENAIKALKSEDGEWSSSSIQVRTVSEKIVRKWYEVHSQSGKQSSFKSEISKIIDQFDSLESSEG